VENIYGQFTLCEKIYKKSKPNDNIIYDNDISKGNIISSTLINYKIESYLTKNVTYSFKYKSIVYEYIEETNEIIPVYMNLSKLTNKNIFNFFNEGLSTKNLVNKFEQRYGNNEYHLNLGLSFFYFKRIESVYLIFILLLQSLNLYFKDLISFLIILGIILIFFFTELIIAKQIVFNLYKKEYTLDGEESKIKVKRKYKLVDNNDIFYEINNCNLLPGDIVYLKSNDCAPCDCLILEGECIVSKYHLTGSLDIEKKKSLENNNEQFDYQLNSISILYHGMKIEKTISKSNEGYITVLCINTGSNTYKANQYSNILYLLEKNLEYKKSYELLGEGRKEVLLMVISIFAFTFIFGAIYFFSLKVSLDFGNPAIKKLFYEILIRIVCKTFMPVYFITNSMIYLIGLFHLKNENISCFDKSKITSPSRINTIFFSKTGILCDTKFEINAYHPFYINSYKSNMVSYRTYKFNQSKEMNSQLLKYYKNYLKHNDPFNKDFNLRQALTMNINKLKHDKVDKDSYEYTTIFLECLLSCNNIEKYNTEIFGNSIETIIFRNLNWDMKSFRFNNNIDDKNKDINYSNISQTNSENNKFEYDGKFNLIDNNINDIYPNNYYKITESMNNDDENELQSKVLIKRLNSKFYQRKTKSNITSEFSITQNNINLIKNNISKSHILSYKLRIYKRFIKNGTLNSSAIVYNFITKELRFMTKGIPEEVLEKCERSTLPDNFENIISLYRRRGFIIIVCAFKIIDVDEYKDSNTLEDYMCDLTFCGFITLKNRLKKKISNSIHELRQFNCNLIISSGDNIFNCLPIGFDSSIIDNKNIFTFDKDDKKNNIIISKICCIKKEREYEKEESDKKTINTINEKLSKQNLSKMSLTPITKPKKALMLKYLKKNNGDDFSDKDNDKKEPFIDNKKFTEIRRARGRTIYKKFKPSKIQDNTKISDKELKVNSKNNNLSPLSL
jgi:magnesium-transporting ATPase (P-type)